MRTRLRPVWALVLAAVLVLAGCGSSADPETWAEAEQDGRFVDAEFEGEEGVVALPADSAVEHNFLQGCMEANTQTLTLVEARVVCTCSFDGLRDALVLEDFQSLDKALRETPNPSDLDDAPEDLWDDTAEDIFQSCARRVDA